MKCLVCGHEESKVVDSRVSAEGDSIRRRRECEKCEYRFTTFERIEDTLPLIVKKDGSRQSFDRQKIRRGIQKACEKRPVSIETIDQMVNDVEKDIQNMGLKEIPSESLGEVVMKKLKTVDDVAYVRFASVYRSFKDVNEFMNEIQDFIKKRS